MNLISKKIQLGDHTLTLESGMIARQATGSVMADIDGTSVLVTVVGINEQNDSKDFFPLTVNYQEKTYAKGQIPGGFFKREGRPSEAETLKSRLIDRPIRPLFPKGFTSEVQIVATVMSVNPEIDPDIPALIGASAACVISGLPITEAMAASRVGYIDGCYVLNPTQTQLKNSKLDLVVAGTESSVLMVESEAQELSEDVMLGAVMYGHTQFQDVLRLINELKEACGKPRWDWTPKAANTALEEQLVSIKAEISSAYQISDKAQRKDKLKELKLAAVEKYATADDSENPITDKEIVAVFERFERDLVRGNILDQKPRIDGRNNTTVRPISVKTGILPRTHGSALFTRGETQALVVATLGTVKDAQVIDGILGEEKDNFLLHYNFPPYCVGEVGMVGSPKRREIGHGKLAKRGVSAVLPTMENFPYVLRVVSEITESNGSSSMASVCGTSLALMDAGVPIKSPVAGIAMGLIKESERFAVLTDILGDEDHLGDMDFKVAGTDRGVTALQMDIKISGITKEIMSQALDQARDGRLHILKIMNDALSAPRSDISQFAPRITSFKINPEKIKDVIGKGGATIRGLLEDKDGATIDIQEDGTVQIASSDSKISEELVRKVKALTEEAEVGKTYKGKVVRITDFGAFVNILPGKDGLVHISQIAHHRVQNVTDELREGQEVQVKLIEIDKQGRLKLSMKALLQQKEAAQ